MSVWRLGGRFWSPDAPSGTSGCLRLCVFPGSGARGAFRVAFSTVSAPSRFSQISESSDELPRRDQNVCFSLRKYEHLHDVGDFDMAFKATRMIVRMIRMIRMIIGHFACELQGGRGCVHACACARVHARVRVCVCVCVSVWLSVRVRCWCDCHLLNVIDA